MTETQLDPQAALLELARIKLADTDLPGVLSRIAELAKASIPGAADVSVTLVRGRTAHTAAFTGAMAIDCDETQYAQGHGPCLDAATTAKVVSIPFMANETRWPDYTPVAVQHGAFSSLSIGLPIHEATLGALNIYGAKPRAFGDEELALANTFAGFAAVALANAHLQDSTSTLARQMQDAMQGRAVIEQAKGIIMGERRCTADEAFGILSKLSQETNRKLRDVATALVDGASSNGPSRNGSGG